MNLKQLLNDLENLEKSILLSDDELDIKSVKTDLKDCCILLRDIMGEPVHQGLTTKEVMADFDAVIDNLKRRIGK